MSLSKKIIDEIYIRINRKQVDGHNIKSVTLGIDLYNHVQNDSSNVFYNNSHKATIFGYPITVSYKRKNLIQINVKRYSNQNFLKRFTKDFVSEYNYAFVGYGDGGRSTFTDTDPLYNIYSKDDDKEDCMKMTWNILKSRNLEHSGKSHLTFPLKSV